MDLTGVPLQKAVIDVLAHPTVASKRFLITIGDRTVGGLTHRDQMVGPWQVPVADVRRDPGRLPGFARARPWPWASARRWPPSTPRRRDAWPWPRPSPTCWPRPSSCPRVKLSANWMAACGEPGEDAALYATVKAVGMELCPQLGISIPVGKDSLSMRTQWNEGGQVKKVTSPVSLIVTAFASLDDVRGTLTPQLDASEDDSTLVLVDLGRGKMRMGGSILGQVLGQSGNEVPDLDDPKTWSLWSMPSTPCAPRARSWPTTTAATAACWPRWPKWPLPAMWACRSTWTCWSPKATASATAAWTSGDRQELGLPGQRAAVTNMTLKATVQRRAGRGALQVRTADRNAVMQTLREHGLSKFSHFIGKTRPSPPIVDAGKGELQVWRDAKSVFRRLAAATCTRSGMRELEDCPAARQPRLRRQPSTPQRRALPTRACTCT